MTLASSLLSSVPGLRHAFFTREGGVSGGIYSALNGGLCSNDDQALVAENRRRMAEHVGAATRFPSMTVRVNEGNLTSFTRTGVQVPAIDLRQTYRALFLEEAAADKAKQRQQFKLHGSILDVVLEQAEKGAKKYRAEEFGDSAKS